MSSIFLSNNSDKPVTIAVGMGCLTDELWQVPRWPDLLTAFIISTYERKVDRLLMHRQGLEPRTR